MEEHESNSGNTAKSIASAVAIGLPVGIVGLTLAVWLITDLDIYDSFATAIMPGVLLGAFSGGFVGMTASMNE
ncbi:MAG TPA: hypothetical protein VFL72_06045 [Acidimicrobiia bacterium]|nr:hypothetical protein [Acidimicrobiia bacterium]